MADARQLKQTVEAILRLERETMAAIRARDIEALASVLAEEFVYRTPGAEVSREDFIKGIASLPGQILSVEGHDQRASVYGETVILTGVQRSRLKTDDGVEHASTVAFTDVFVKQDGRWRLALAHGVELPAESGEPAPR